MRTLKLETRIPKTNLRTPILALTFAVIASGLVSGHVNAQVVDAPYAYRSSAFTRLIDDSGKYVATDNASKFYAWFEGAYASNAATHPVGAAKLGLVRALDQRRTQIAALSGEARTKLEIETGAWLHRTVKTLIPTFSLDRGFEFSYTVSRGERQCLLQSVLIAGMLQRAGVNAGLAMVWRNPTGTESNLGHAATLIRLPNKDIVVDASEPEPFATHQGLFVLDAATNSYHFVVPTYAQDSSITAYKTPDTKTVALSGVRSLDYNFVRSQFYFYRGERATNGFLAKPGTPDGLAASASALEMAIKIQPRNPLAVYVLGHVYRRLGKVEQARTQYTRGYQLYQTFGYVPAGALDAYHQYVEK